jgi:type IV secretory pathway VirB10-like protein
MSLARHSHAFRPLVREEDNVRPIPERANREIPQADAALLEFIDRRRRQQARRRRQLVVVAGIAAVGVVVVAIAAMLILSGAQPTAPTIATSPSTRAAAPSPSASAPSAPRPAPSHATATPAPKVALPPAASSSARAVESDRAPRTSPASRELDTTPAPAADPSAVSDPAQRTAIWLVHTYGRLEAENRALRVAEFYAGERRAFWQRVATDVRALPER